MLTKVDVSGKYTRYVLFEKSAPINTPVRLVFKSILDLLSAGMWTNALAPNGGMLIRNFLSTSRPVNTSCGMLHFKTGLGVQFRTVVACFIAQNQYRSGCIFGVRRLNKIAPLSMALPMLVMVTIALSIRPLSCGV